MKNAQQWIEENYPVKERGKIITLKIDRKGLEGGLKLTGFKKLQNLIISDNCLTDLDLINCRKLTDLDASFNQLRKLILPVTKNQTIKSLKLSNNLLLALPRNIDVFHSSLEILELSNNIIRLDLTFFSNFINLKKLWLDQNPINGSLLSLAHLRSLREINISSTEIYNGLEFLPRSLEKIFL